MNKLGLNQRRVKIQFLKNIYNEDAFNNTINIKNDKVFPLKPKS